jgi:transcriptional regulator with GAF, ATPase, and Fis domain
VSQNQPPVDAQQLARDLRDALTVVAIAGTVGAPVGESQLLEMIVRTAADVIGAQAASLFLLDEATQELVFEVALGGQAEAVKKFRVQVGHGVAGLVALTGEPMAIANASQDPRQASDISGSVGYTPQNILCVPLVYQERIIGVLELLDKAGAASFRPADMATLGLFASQAAVAIQQSRIVAGLGDLLRATFGPPLGTGPVDLGARLQAYARQLETDDSFKQAVELAALVHAVSRDGPQETAFVFDILRAAARYARERAAPVADAWSPAQ